MSISKLFVPKIKRGLDDRNDKIKNDLDEAKNLKEKSEQKQIEYEKIIEEAKKEVQKMIFESKNKLEADINLKNKAFDAEITKEIVNCICEVNNSHKIGHYMPGTNIPVVSENIIFKKKPDYLLLLSWHISKELINNLKKKGYKGKFIIPLPKPRIVS